MFLGDKYAHQGSVPVPTGTVLLMRIAYKVLLLKAYKTVLDPFYFEREHASSAKIRQSCILVDVTTKYLGNL